MERNYIAFISYCHRMPDKALARKLHKRIESYTIPWELRQRCGGKKHPGIVFRDQEELAAACSLTDVLREALDHARFLVLICTPNTPKSEYVQEEIRYFLLHHTREQILTVLAEGEPETAFPPLLRTFDGENRTTEPLAADLRATKKGGISLRPLRRELLRLIAPMIGCGYPDLVQRQRRRRAQQAAAAAGAALAVCLSFSAMLLRKNREIEAQKQEVLLRESQLLAGNAADMLEEGHLYDALDSALRALPLSGDRPYYALAESVLMEAMDIFAAGKNSVYLAETVVEQATPISNFCYSQDGSRVITGDDYGVVRCFDTAHGEPLWTGPANSTHSSVSHLLTQNPQGNVICLSGSQLSCLSLSTGELRWEHWLDIVTSGYLCCDNRQGRIACLDTQQIPSNGSDLLSLVLLSADTGAVEQTIPLGTLDLSSAYSFTSLFHLRLPGDGVFSEDGRYFAGVFLEQTGEGFIVLNCFLADLDQGTGSIFLRQELEGDNVMMYTPVRMALQGDDLYLVLYVPDTKVAAMAMRIDWKQGTVLWQMCTPPELQNQIFFTWEPNTFAEFGTKILTVARGNGIYSIDMETGQILASAFPPGNITAFQSVDTGYFGITLSSGSYLLGWLNDNGFHLSSDLQVDVDIGTHDVSQIFRDGILHKRKYADTGFVLTLAPGDSAGSLAVLDPKNTNRLLIKEPLLLERPVSRESIALPAQCESCSDLRPVFCSEERLVLGPFHASGEYDRGTYVVIHTGTHTVEKVIPAETIGGYKDAYNWILPDLSGYVRQDAYGSVIRVQNGKQIVLAREGEFRTGTVSSAGVYLPDGSVLTAWADEERLILWENGQETLTAPLPEALRISPDDIWAERLLKAGANGYVLAGRSIRDEAIDAGSLAVYDISHDSWSSLAGDIAFTNHDAIGFGEKEPLLALVAETDTICVWNLESGEPVCRISLDLPQDAVTFLGFLLDDTHLMLKTEDTVLVVYDLSTGECKYQAQYGQTYGGILTAYEDRKNQRLYIIDSYRNTQSNGVCLDLRSWTELGGSGDMVCFDESRGEIYHFEPGFDPDQPLKYTYIPDTETLIRLGQALLEVF
ncbi:MAG: PQQ-binding-like beta-propeller repeat protein [Faecousia sp.]